MNTYADSAVTPADDRSTDPQRSSDVQGSAPRQLVHHHATCCAASAARARMIEFLAKLDAPLNRRSTGSG